MRADGGENGDFSFEGRNDMDGRGGLLLEFLRIQVLVREQDFDNARRLIVERRLPHGAVATTPEAPPYDEVVALHFSDPPMRRLSWLLLVCRAVAVGGRTLDRERARGEGFRRRRTDHARERDAVRNGSTQCAVSGQV